MVGDRRTCEGYVNAVSFVALPKKEMNFLLVN